MVSKDENLAESPVRDPKSWNDDITNILGFKKLQLLEKSEKGRKANIIGFLSLIMSDQKFRSCLIFS